MFSLDGKIKYWMYNKPVDMRKSFNGLSGLVTNAMGADVRNGDTYIFMNSSRNMMKMIRKEEAGLVMYAIRLDIGRMKPINVDAVDTISSAMTYLDLIKMVESVLESPYVRRMKMLAKTV